MKVLGVIPARFGSSRFPGKPLIDLKGKTMIQRVYEGAAKSALITELIVATDDQRIFDEVKRFGGKVEMTSEQHSTGTDRCAEVLERNPDFDIVVNIQGDEPLVDYRQIDQLIGAFCDANVQIATMGSGKISLDDLNNPNRIKIVLNNKNAALYFSRSCIPNFHNAKQEPLTAYPYMRHIGLYAYRAQVLRQLTQLAETALEKTESLEQLKWLYHDFKIQVVETDIETPNIDVPADVEKVMQLL